MKRRKEKAARASDLRAASFQSNFNARNVITPPPGWHVEAQTLAPSRVDLAPLFSREDRAGIRPRHQADSFKTVALRMMEFDRRNLCASYLEREHRILNIVFEKVGDMPLNKIKVENLFPMFCAIAKSENDECNGNMLARELCGYCKDVFDFAAIENGDDKSANPCANLERFFPLPLLVHRGSAK
jgi:hypothetical protein